MKSLWMWIWWEAELMILTFYLIQFCVVMHAALPLQSLPTCQLPSRSSREDLSRGAHPPRICPSLSSLPAAAAVQNRCTLYWSTATVHSGLELKESERIVFTMRDASTNSRNFKIFWNFLVFTVFGFGRSGFLCLQTFQKLSPSQAKRCQNIDWTGLACFWQLEALENHQKYAFVFNVMVKMSHFV